MERVSRYKGSTDGSARCGCLMRDGTWICLGRVASFRSAVTWKVMLGSWFPPPIRLLLYVTHLIVSFPHNLQPGLVVECVALFAGMFGEY